MFFWSWLTSGSEHSKLPVTLRLGVQDDSGDGIFFWLARKAAHFHVPEAVKDELRLERLAVFVAGERVVVGVSRRSQVGRVDRAVGGERAFLQHLGVAQFDRRPRRAFDFQTNPPDEVDPEVEDPASAVAIRRLDGLQLLRDFHRRAVLAVQRDSVRRGEHRRRPKRSSTGAGRRSARP